MGDESPLDQEAVENLYEQMYDLYLEDKLSEEGIDESQMNKAQIIFRQPFKNNQFDGLDGGDSNVDVRINDDVQVISKVKLDTDREIKKGDSIYWNEIDGFEGTMSIPDLGDDVGHVTFIWLPDRTILVSFDFDYNMSYLSPLLDAANEFVEMAAVAHENEMWRAFIENAFHAAERMMKIRVILHGEPAYDHSLVQSNYRKWAESGTGNPDLWDTYNQLKDKYRLPGSYVDPGNHPKGVDEKEFELEESEADHILSVLKNHKNSIKTDTNDG